MSNLPKFIVVLCVAPSGTFRRCGLTFTRMWRPLEIGQTADVGAIVPVITPEMFAAIDYVSKPQNPHKSAREPLGPPMLSWRPSSADEVGQLLEAQPVDASNPRAVADMNAKIADLEAKVLRAELAGGRGDPDALAAKDRELADVKAQLDAAQAANAATNDRLAKLEQLLAGGGGGGQTQADGKVGETKPTAKK